MASAKGWKRPFSCQKPPATNPVCPIYTQSQKLPKIHGVKFGSRFFGSSKAISWVTVGHGKLRAANKGHMDIIFQGGRVEETSQNPPLAS